MFGDRGDPGDSRFELLKLRLELREPKRQLFALATLPFYWLLMSVACLAAIWQLVRQPHYWAKTPHRGRARGPDGSGPRT